MQENKAFWRWFVYSIKQRCDRRLFGALRGRSNEPAMPPLHEVYTINGQMLDTIPEYCNQEGISYRELADGVGVSPAAISQVIKGLGTPKFRLLVGRAVNDFKRERAEQKRVGDGDAGKGAPKCPACGSPMIKSGKRFHYYHRQLTECWTCKRKCNAGMYGVPAYGPFAGILIRLDRARNPHTGAEVSIPWRHKMSPYELRHGLVWCDQTSHRPDGCGSILSYQRTHSSGLKIFGHRKSKCKKYRGKPVYHLAGKVQLEKPERTSSLPAKAQIHAHCGGRVYRRMGHAYSHMNPLRAARPELVRCRCVKCRRTLYFNVRRGRFEDELPVGKRLIDDPCRPSCRRCGPTRRFALRARLLARNHPLIPRSVRTRLQGIKAKGNESVAIRYSCRHMVVWKMPDGEVITRRLRQPGRPSTSSHPAVKSPLAQTR